MAYARASNTHRVVVLLIPLAAPVRCRSRSPILRANLPRERSDRRGATPPMRQSVASSVGSLTMNTSTFLCATARGTKYGVLTTQAAPKPDKTTGRIPTDEGLARVAAPDHERDPPGKGIANGPAHQEVSCSAKPRPRACNCTTSDIARHLQAPRRMFDVRLTDGTWCDAPAGGCRFARSEARSPPCWCGRRWAGRSSVRPRARVVRYRATDRR